MDSTLFLLCLAFVGNFAAPPKNSNIEITSKNKKEKYIVYPGLDVDNAAVATWTNGYTSPWNVVFGNQPYVVGWVGQEDELPWEPFDEDYTYEDSYEKASSDTGVDVPHDQVDVDRKSSRKKRGGLDFLKWPLSLNLVSLVADVDDKDSWATEESESESGLFSKEEEEAADGGVLADTGVDAPHDEVEQDRGKVWRTLHLLKKPSQVAVDAPHDHVDLDRSHGELKKKEH